MADGRGEALTFDIEGFTAHERAAHSEGTADDELAFAGDADCFELISPKRFDREPAVGSGFGRSVCKRKRSMARSRFSGLRQSGIASQKFAVQPMPMSHSFG